MALREGIRCDHRELSTLGAALLGGPAAIGTADLLGATSLHAHLLWRSWAGALATLPAPPSRP
jgi:hypothetical protein